MSIVSGLTFVSERESGPWIDCAPCSGVMAAHYGKTSVPATLAAAHKVRSAAGRPHSGGMTASQVRAGLREAYGVSATVIERSEVPTYLARGYAVVVALTYSRLPSHLRRWQPSFTGGHSVCLAGRRSDGKVGWFDPLGTSSWDGEWVAWADVDQAVWTEAGACYAIKKAEAPPAPPAPTLRYGGKAMSGRRRVTKNDCRIRERPSTSARILREVDAGATFAARQYTDTGTSVGGDRRWYGTLDGKKWIHRSLVASDGAIRGNETVR